MYLDATRCVRELPEVTSHYELALQKTIEKDIVNYYLGEMESLEAILSPDGPPLGDPIDDRRLTVIDLPSIPNNKMRSIIVNELLTTEWERGKLGLADALNGKALEDTRVPTFILVDEAHNLMPETARGPLANAVKEQFRTIAAEGRKFGIFLVLVTQRPEKLDPFVISECENHAVMKLGSRSGAKEVSKLLGINNPGFQNFKKGSFVLSGTWAKKAKVIGYTAGRRTCEGGRDLRAEFWAAP